MRYAAWLLLFAALASAQKRPFTPDDLWAWRTLSDPRIAADGRRVAWVEGWNDRRANAVRANIRIAALEGAAVRFPEGDWLDSTPRWSPDGSQLAWISERGGQAQIYVRALDGGSERRLTNLDSPPLSLAWSPDGRTIAFTAQAPVERADAPWAPPEIFKLLRPQSAPRVQLYVVPAAGGAVRPISRGDSDFSGEPAWTPDGQWILTVRDRSAICAWRASGDGMRVLVSDPGTYETPLPSPDGSKIAYLFRAAKPLAYVVRKVYVMNADGSRSRPLSGALDRDAASPQWSSDSRTVYFLADDRGATRVCAARNDGTLRQVTGEAERLRGFSISDGGRAVTVRSDASHPLDLIAFGVFTPKERAAIAAPNDAWLAGRERGSVEQIQYESGGAAIQAFLVKPPAFDSSKRYPLLADVHDAPRAMCGSEFDLRSQVFAAAGFLVLCANTRGAPGFGEDFENVLPTRLPGDDFDDLMRGVDAVLGKEYADPRRLALSGGITAAWALGHTERFASVVAVRPKAWIARAPWDDPDLFRARSPIFFARSFRTPTLVVADEQDPESDAIYEALQAQKARSALVRVPGARPGGRVLELQAALAWFKSLIQ